MNSPLNNTSNWDDLFLSSFSIVSLSAIIDVHRHHCFHICVSINYPYDCVVGGTSIKATRGILVNQHVPHNCYSPQTSKLVHFIDPEGLWGRTLKEMLNGAPFMELSRFLNEKDFHNILPSDYTSMPVSALKPYIEKFLSNLFQPYMMPIKMERDERITKALDYINSNIQHKINLLDVATHIFLSSERTRHLFLEQVGMSFKQYLIWKRIRSLSLAIVQQHVNPAEGCTSYGFTDYSHFSRLFKQMFGMPPGHIYKNTKVILS